MHKLQNAFHVQRFDAELSKRAGICLSSLYRAGGTNFFSKLVDEWTRHLQKLTQNFLYWYARSGTNLFFLSSTPVVVVVVVVVVIIMCPWTILLLWGGQCETTEALRPVFGEWSTGGMGFVFHCGIALYRVPSLTRHSFFYVRETIDENCLGIKRESYTIIMFVINRLGKADSSQGSEQ